MSKKILPSLRRDTAYPVLAEMDLPEWLVEAMPAIGLIGASTSAFYLYLMRRKLGDTYTFFYGLIIVDFIFFLSLLYAGIHGIKALMQSDTTLKTKPIACLSEAFHSTLWIYCDGVNLFFLTVLCIDQFVSVIWSKTHKALSSNYFNLPTLAIILILGLAIIGPAWHRPLASSSLSLEMVSSMCYMSDVFYTQFYEWLMIARISNIAGITNGLNAQHMFFCVLLRCSQTLVSVHLPILITETSNLTDNRLTHLTEYGIRLTQGALFASGQILVIFILPKYTQAMKEFWTQSADTTKRNWQSVDDPPVNNNMESSDPVFGSWYSTGGNIIGEAGVPNEINAGNQRSISFYCNQIE
uniref:G_PROTEIN_RECEP_F1_2 domain-containing protein n=1 Tax=Panagrellus redivivus TaxID=6233 RepID=A0A7E4W3P8_PANRE